jgi:hypothetical protein
MRRHRDATLDARWNAAVDCADVSGRTKIGAFVVPIRIAGVVR